jgi:hypothetical protein
MSWTPQLESYVICHLIEKAHALSNHDGTDAKTELVQNPFAHELRAAGNLDILARCAFSFMLSSARVRVSRVTGSQ